MDLETLQKALLISPYQRWLGIEAVAVFDNGIELRLPWREELVSNPVTQSTHGGILASLIDLSGLYAILACGGNVAATADLQVDYHRPALPGDLRIVSTVVKKGRRTSIASSELFGSEHKLLASGRGLYLAGG